MTHYSWPEDGDKQCGCPGELREVPGPGPATKWGPQYYKHKELNLATTCMNLEVDFP